MPNNNDSNSAQVSLLCVLVRVCSAMHGAIKGLGLRLLEGCVFVIACLQQLPEPPLWRKSPLNKDAGDSVLWCLVVWLLSIVVILRGRDMQSLVELVVAARLLPVPPAFLYVGCVMRMYALGGTNDIRVVRTVMWGC